LVRILRTVVEIAMLAMLDAWMFLPFRRAIVPVLIAPITRGTYFTP
jgi:hypothetical protein